MDSRFVKARSEIEGTIGSKNAKNKVSFVFLDKVFFACLHVFNAIAAKMFALRACSSGTRRATTTRQTLQCISVFQFRGEGTLIAH